MNNSRIFNKLLTGVVIILLSATTSFSAQTFVVLDNVVFVRDDPKVASPLESMTVSEIQNEYLKFTTKFPPHFFYGQNVRGDLEPGILDAVKIYGSFQEPGKAKIAISGYIDKKRLWQEPPLVQANAPTSLTLQDVSVLIVPEKTARKVLSLYQGEVVETIGRLQYDGQWWIKAKFVNRYGYIPEQEIQPLAEGTVDESLLSMKEIPRLDRNADRALLDKERVWLAHNGFFIEPVDPSRHLAVDDMADLYQGISSAVFLTSDLYLHAFHLIFDRMLQNIERERIYPEILALTTRLVDESSKDKKAYTGPDEKLKQAMTYNLFFVSVAAKLLDPAFPVAPEVSSDVELVVKSIIEASGSMPALKNDMNPGKRIFQCTAFEDIMNLSLRRMPRLGGTLLR